jgi:hypothetical protein
VLKEFPDLKEQFCKVIEDEYTSKIQKVLDDIKKKQIVNLQQRADFQQMLSVKPND